MTTIGTITSERVNQFQRSLDSEFPSAIRQTDLFLEFASEGFRVPGIKAFSENDDI